MQNNSTPPPAQNTSYDIVEIFSGDDDFLWLTLGFSSPINSLDVLHIVCGKTKTNIPEQDMLYLERSDQDMACTGEVFSISTQDQTILLELTSAGAAALSLSMQTRFTFHTHPHLYAMATRHLAQMKNSGQTCIKL